MTRASELLDLADRVEKAEGACRRLDAEIAVSSGQVKGDCLNEPCATVSAALRAIAEEAE